MAYRDIYDGKTVDQVINSPLIDEGDNQDQVRAHYWDGQAMGPASWPTSLAGVLLAFGLYICLSVLVSLGLIGEILNPTAMAELDAVSSRAEFDEYFIASLIGPDASIFTLMILFASIAVMIPCIWLAGKWLQRWKFGDILSNVGRFRWKLAVYATGVGLIVTLGMAVVDWQLGFIVAREVPTFNGFSTKLLTAIIFVAPLVVLQSSAEEILFRGYLPQSLHHILPGLLKNRILIAGFCSVIFAALHWSNPGVEDYRWHIMAHFVVMSMAISWLSLRLGGIEVACVLHALNNLTLLILVSGEGLGIGNVALYTASVDPDFGGSLADWLVQGVQIAITITLFWVVGMWRSSPLSLAKLVD